MLFIRPIEHSLFQQTTRALPRAGLDRQIGRFVKLFTLAIAMTLAASYAIAQTKTTMTNPAATFCVENEGTFEIRKNADGSEHGVCILPNGQEVDAWDYLRSHFEN